MASKEVLKEYEIVGNPCGYGVIIVNHFKDDANLLRKGTENEKKSLVELFKKLGIKMHGGKVYEDLTKKEMTDLLEEVSKQQQELRNASILVIAISSHGGKSGGEKSERGKSGLFGVDVNVDQPGDPVTDDLIWRRFNEKCCKEVKDKPKLLLLNGCRGHTVNVSNLDVTTDSNASPKEKYEDTGTDFLTICSDVDDYGQFKQREKDSLFIKLLTIAIEGNDKLKSLPSLLPIINAELVKHTTYTDDEENETYKESLSEMSKLLTKELILKEIK